MTATVRRRLLDNILVGFDVRFKCSFFLRMVSSETLLCTREGLSLNYKFSPSHIQANDKWSKWRQRTNAENSTPQHTHCDRDGVAHLAHVYRHERVSMLIRSGSFLMIPFPTFPTRQHVHSNTLARHVNEWPPLQCSNIRKQRHKKWKTECITSNFRFSFVLSCLHLFRLDYYHSQRKLPLHGIFLSI